MAMRPFCTFCVLLWLAVGSSSHGTRDPVDISLGHISVEGAAVYNYDRKGNVLPPLQDGLPPADHLRAVGSRHDILVWQMRLNSSQCTSQAASPCFNIYSINSTTGELLWFAYRWVKGSRLAA